MPVAIRDRCHRDASNGRLHEYGRCAAQCLVIIVVIVVVILVVIVVVIVVVMNRWRQSLTIVACRVGEAVPSSSSSGSTGPVSCSRSDMLIIQLFEV